MKRFSGSQYIQRLCNHPTLPKFRSNANRFTINRSNLRVIEAKEQAPKEQANAGNNIEVPCAPPKVNNDEVLKDYDDDLDEISDSPLVDEADEFENVSEGSLCADSDMEDVGLSIEKQVEIPVGYRPYSNRPLTKYKKVAFFKPRLYFVSRHRVVVGCLNTHETNSEVTSIKNEEIVSSVEHNEEVNAEADVECNENTEVETDVPDEQLLEPVQGKLLIQAELDTSEEVILGKEFLVEIWEEPDVTLKNYLCLLCDADLAKDEVVDHFIGIPHRIAYLDKHFPKFTSMFYKNSSLNNSQEKLPIATICKDISDAESALSFITSHAYVSSYRHKLEKEVSRIFRTKDSIAMLLKELCLTVGAKSEEFADDLIDYSFYETVAVSGYVADSPESEEEDGFVVLSVEQDDDENIELQNDPVDVIHVEKSDVNPSELCNSKQQVKMQENSNQRHCSRNRHHRFSHHNEKEAALSTEAGKAKSTSGLKSGEDSSKSSSSTNVTKSTSSTKHVSSSSKSDSKNKNSADTKEKTSSSHCEKCNGVKKGYVGSKRHAKHCECRKGSSVTTGRDAKRKEDSSKENTSRKSEHSRSVTSSSHEKKNSVRDSSSSAKTKSSNDANSRKVHSSDSRSSRHKGQSVSHSKDGAVGKVGKSSEKKTDSVHSKNEKKEGDNESGNHQSRNNDKKSGDSKVHHPSTGHRSRSPRRSLRLSPKKSNDAKSINGSHGGTLSSVRKTRTSPVRQSTETGTSRNRKRSPLKNSTSEQKQQKLADNSQNANWNRSRSPRRSVRRRSRSPLSTRKRSKSPFSTRKRSKSPLTTRKRSRSPLATRRRSRSPLPFRRRSRSPLQPRKRSRSPLSVRKRSPLSIQKRSKSPLNVSRKRSRSPITLVRSGKQVMSPRRGSPLQVRVGRFRPVLVRKRSRSPIRSNFRRSVSPLNRRWERSISRSPSERHTRSISSEREMSYENPYIDPPFPVVNDPFQDNVHLPIPPVHPPQPYVPDSFSAPWPAPNPPDNYQYNFPYPPANPAYLPTAYPQYAGHPPQVPLYPNTAFPPPVAQPAPVPPPDPHYAPPVPLPVPPVSAGMPPQNVPPDPRVPVCYPNFAALPTAHNPNEKVFHELRNVVTKLFGMNDSRAPTEAESRNVLHKGLSSTNERNFDRSSHSNDIPFLGSAGTSKPLPSQMPPEQQERMFKDALQKLRSEFGAFQIPEEILKLALKGMFPEHMLNDRAFEIANAKSLEQSQNLSRSPKHPNVNARVEFKESSLLPKQGNIFPIVNQNPPFRNEPFANSNNRSGFPDVKQRNVNDLDLRLRSNFPGGAHGQGGSGPSNQPEKKTLASRLASVLIKLGMIDVPGPLLSEMLHRIGVFNKSLPLQDITENEIISVLDKCGYLQRK